AIPLVSVVFILLVFILLVGTLSAPGSRQVELPEAASGEDATGGVAELTVDAAGLVHAAGMTMEIDDIGPELFAPGQRTVALRADRAVASDRLVALLGALQAAGLEEVRLVVR